MNTVLQDMVEHHIWATETLLTFCETLTPEQLQVTVPGTFGGAEATLAHVAANEEHYLKMIDQGGLPTGISTTIFDGEVPRKLASVRSVFARTGPAWRDVVHRCPENTVLQVEWEGSIEQLPLSVVVTQVLEHGTEHRTHIRTILAAHGIARDIDEGTTEPDLSAWAWQDVREGVS
ncbi:MAG TPA: DinB family protein [Thermomicrobiales bacterium]|nr:DinB family protein [Thermomicrobiales bacterium]